MKRFLAAFLVTLFTAAPAFALTAGDVLDKMTEKERAGYLQGAIEMAMVADTARAACIGDWYFEGDGKAQKAIVAAFDKYRDKPAAAILNALIRKQCGQQ